MSEQAQLVVRYAHDGDIDFLTNSWLESFRDGYFNATVPNRIYFTQQHKVLERLLPRATVLLLCDSMDPTHIVSWLCYEVQDNVMVVHYVYTKNILREKGLARRLFEFAMGNVSSDIAKNVVITTHQTHKSKHFIKGRREKHHGPHQGKAMLPYERRHPDNPIQFMYNPYWLMENLYNAV